MLAFLPAVASPPADAFGARLWNALPADRGNVVVSPISLEACLGLLIPGVGPASRPPLAKTLGVPPSTLDAYSSGLQRRLRAVTTGGEATLSNVGFFATPVSAAYQTELTEGYGGTVERLRKGSAGVRQVNDWIDAKTKGRIPSLFERLPPDVSAVLVNAVTFDGRWAVAFPPEETKSAPFKAPGGTKSVPTMHLKGKRFLYARGDGFRMVALPYRGGRYRMTVLLPDWGDPSTLLRSDWRRTWATARESTVDLALPRFAVRSKPDVQRAVEKMGLRPLFANLDFRRAVPSGAVQKIDLVVQRTYVKVGENGVEAAAASGIAMSRSARPLVPSVVFHVDRPFAFLIESSSDEILFQGVVREP